MINSAYSNPGVLMPMAGIKTSFVKGHDLDLWWIWTLLDRTATLRAGAQQSASAAMPAAQRAALAAAQFDHSLTHEISLSYTWTLNPHFDIRLTGNVIIPQDGAKDIARTQNCDELALRGVSNTTFRACEGDEVALRGEARFRARF